MMMMMNNLHKFPRHLNSSTRNMNLVVIKRQSLLSRVYVKHSILIYPDLSEELVQVLFGKQRTSD